MLAGAYYHGEAGLFAMLSLGVLATFLWYMTVPAPHRKDVVGQHRTDRARTCVHPAAGATGSSRSPSRTTFETSVVVAVIGLTFVFDTSAFLVGSVWGGSFIQRPLAPAMSPKKSVEGLIGAHSGHGHRRGGVRDRVRRRGTGIFEDGGSNAVMLGLVVALAATFGDLAESLVKRDVGIKDMGSVLPGHGGVLDRIDSLLFVAPAALLLLRVIFAFSVDRCLFPCGRGSLFLMRTVTILGSTGSVGTQALDVVRRNPERFKVVGVSVAGTNQELLWGRSGVPPAGGRDRG